MYYDHDMYQRPNERYIIISTFNFQIQKDKNKMNSKELKLELQLELELKSKRELEFRWDGVENERNIPTIASAYEAWNNKNNNC